MVTESELALIEPRSVSALDPELITTAAPPEISPAPPKETTPALSEALAPVTVDPEESASAVRVRAPEVLISAFTKMSLLASTTRLSPTSDKAPLIEMS